MSEFFAKIRVFEFRKMTQLKFNLKPERFFIHELFAEGVHR